MRIARMDVFPITMRLIDPVPMASGVISSTGNVLVRLIDDDGAVGWGEGVEAPALTHQDQASIVSDLEALRPLVVGADPTRITDLWLRIRTALPKATTALGAVDIALHDLMGRRLQVPVHELIGGRVRDVVPALSLVGSGETGRDVDKLEEKLARGISWFKLKLGLGSPETELATISAALDLVGEEGVICGDANEAWSEDEATTFLGSLAGMGVRFVEQPVSREDPETLARVAARSPVPICADEGAGSLDAVLSWAGSGVGGVSLKLIKHGGITGVMRGAAICSVAGLEVNLAGKVIESTVSAAANLHCAAAMDRIEYGCSPANQGVVQDVSHEPVGMVDGRFAVPTTPGLGVEVDEDLVVSLAD